MKIGIASIILAASLWGLAAAAQSGRGSMGGYVSLAHDGEHARVEMISATPDSAARYETQTDDAGRYSIGEMLMGEYRLKISAPGYKSYETRIYIPSDFAGRIAVKLEPRAQPRKGEKS